MISLDTNAVIAAINRRVPRVRPRLEAAIAAGDNVGLSTVVLFELRYGIIKRARPQENNAILEALLALDVTPWPFDSEDAHEAVKFVRSLSVRACRSANNDVLIAAQTRRRGALSGHSEHLRICASAGPENRELGDRLSTGSYWCPRQDELGSAGFGVVSAPLVTLI
jgi:tRNA(fMet)-specific endonuclease VapC